MNVLRRILGQVRRVVQKDRTVAPNGPGLINARLDELDALLAQIASDGAPVSDEAPVIFGAILPGHTIWACMGGVLSYFFRGRGQRAMHLIDDGQIPDLNTVRRGLQSDERCVEWLAAMKDRHLNDPCAILPPDRRFDQTMQILRRSHGQGQPATAMVRDIIKEHPVDLKRFASAVRAAQDGILGTHALATHRRIFGGRPFDPNTSQHLLLAQLSVKASMIGESVADWLAGLPDGSRFIQLDGIYAFGGALGEAARARGVSCKAFQPNGFANRTIYIGHRPFPMGWADNRYQEFARRPPQSMLHQAERLLAVRTRAAAREPGQVEKELINRIHQARESGRPVLGVFPNIPWDAALPERDCLFDSMAHWLSWTVEWAQQQGALVLLREHPRDPQEYSRWASALALLEDYRSPQSTSEHLWVIPATSPVSSFVLAPRLDCCMVYNSTISMELAYLGCPVVFAARSPYSGMNMGYEPTDLGQLERRLTQFIANPKAHDKRQDEFASSAVLAAAYHLVNNAHYCPMMPTVEAFRKRGPERYWSRWDSQIDLFDPTRNPSWNRTIDRFLEAEPQI